MTYTDSTVALAKFLMKLRSSPVPSPDDMSLNEIFRHENYINASPERKHEIRYQSSLHRYSEESRKPFFLTYFNNYRSRSDFRSDKCDGFAQHLAGKVVLDFGCFTGGRGVRWAELYDIKLLLGTDISPVYLEAASEFATSKEIPHEYRLIAEGGLIPFEDESVDTIVTFDVFEHVDDLRRSLRECLRVLRPGGVIFAVFPSFYNPIESHLDFATRTPGLQWIFSGETLTRAYFEILSENPDKWYMPNLSLSDWEKLPTLNGTTSSGFHKLVREMPIELEHVTRTPVFTTGTSHKIIRKTLIKPLVSAVLQLRVFDDYLLDRIAVVLRKPS